MDHEPEILSASGRGIYLCATVLGVEPEIARLRAEFPGHLEDTVIEHRARIELAILEVAAPCLSSWLPVHHSAI